MFLRAGEIVVHVDVAGPAGAPVLLLLHSLGTGLQVWEAQARALAGAFRVVRPDLRGHGLTDCPRGPYKIETLARDQLALLDALGIARAQVAGLSIGGLVAQSMAALAPGRVTGLVLCDTALAIPPAASWTARAAEVRAHGMGSIAEGVMARWITPAFAGDPAAAGLRRMLLCTPPEGYAACAEAIAACDLSAAARALAVPALVLVGDRDEATPPASARALCEAIPGARLQVIEQAAHLAPVEQPEAVTRAMRAFLAPSATADKPATPPADALAAGLAVRRQVLGDAHVDRATAAATDLDRDFQAFITRAAWGGVWTRPGLDRRTRSLLTLAMLATLGHHEELRLHLRATRNTGASPAEVGEMLIQVAAYAGIPAANSAMRIAKDVFAETPA